MIDFKLEIQASQKLKEAVDQLKKEQPDAFYNQTVKEQVSKWEDSPLKEGILKIIADREEKERDIINNIKNQ